VKKASILFFHIIMVFLIIVNYKLLKMRPSLLYLFDQAIYQTPVQLHIHTPPDESTKTMMSMLMTTTKQMMTTMVIWINQASAKRPSRWKNNSHN
jgi:hypothetical protein